MNARSVLLALSLLLMLPTVAQEPQPETTAEYSRERYITEIRAYKHEFLARQLDLSREVQRSFFPSYDAMEDEIMQLNEDTRELERRVENSTEASDVEVEAAAAAIYGQKAREAEIESRYYDIFKEQLSPRQLLRLRGAERRFNQYMMRHHRRARSEGRGPRR